MTTQHERDYHCGDVCTCAKRTPYTSGPWQLDSSGRKENGSSWLITAVDGLRTIAICPPDYSEEDVANAQLLASAPDLYEMLEAVTRQAETTRLVLHTSLCQEFDSCVDACIDSQYRNSEARAALAKVRGE